MRIKALQLTSHSAFQPAGGRVWRQNLGASVEPRRRCGSQLSADPLGSEKRVAERVHPTTLRVLRVQSSRT